MKNVKKGKITLEKIEKKINDLKKKIEYHNNLYYNEDKQEISDYEYDMMLKKLQKLEKEYPNLATENSPSKKIGGTASSAFEKVDHKVQI